MRGLSPMCVSPMCELLALHSNVQTAATFSFSGFSARGGDTGDQGDGWGMAFHDGEACRVFIDAGRACDAPLVDFLRRHPLRARTCWPMSARQRRAPLS